MQMSRKEIWAYVVTAIIGGAAAGHSGGVTGVLGLFVGLAIVGFVDLLFHSTAKHDSVKPPVSSGS
jgi:hypothetical protein